MVPKYGVRTKSSRTLNDPLQQIGSEAYFRKLISEGLNGPEK